MPAITGDESPADIMRLAIETFSNSLTPEVKNGVEITYQGDIPILTYSAQVRDGLGEFVCQYRLDKMLLLVFPECEGIFEQVLEYGLWGDDPDPKGRAKTVNHLAWYAMNMMLSRLLLHQLVLFAENFDDAKFLTAGVFLTGLAKAYQETDAPKAAKAAKGGVISMLDSRMEHLTKSKREMLVSLLNRMPMLSIPTGPGRPPGTTKPAEVKAQEAAEFEKKVEETIRQLLSSGKKMPTKTAVAKALGIGGLNPKTGIDSSLPAFRNKLDRLSVDYNAIAERVRLNK